MKHYDRAYFDRWYRNPATRINRPVDVTRKVVLAVSLTEYFLGRKLRRVLDVGCGEGNWRAPLKKLRPDATWLGLDTSPYVVERFGRSRNIHCMGFAQLAEQRFGEPFDLVLCTNVLPYLPAGEIRRGLSGFAELLYGVAFLESYVRGDDLEGDRVDFHQRPAAWYRAAFADAELLPCGPQAWLSADLAEATARLDLPAGS